MILRSIISRQGISLGSAHSLTKIITGRAICFPPSVTTDRANFSPRSLLPSKRSFFNSTEAKDDESSEIFYEGPFAPMSLRVKFVSISSAIVGAFGVPILLYMYSGNIPEAAQYALGGTTMLTACGSTVAVHYCLTPYVHTMEHVDTPQCLEKANETDTEKFLENALEFLENSSDEKKWVKATWRNLFVMRQEIVFDAAKDALPYNGLRPFCNFSVNGIPLYVHPELIMDDSLRKMLLGGDVANEFDMPKDRVRKGDEDELIAKKKKKNI
mmetsp:Transcript_25695/g.29348  ORF Transcript_25695/g.29348 Transcript_25695/m.29348 type:complete len:270 (-) Transcript_25695:8-817(-)